MHRLVMDLNLNFGEMSIIDSRILGLISVEPNTLLHASD
jgi:hypothetical protein